MLLREVELLLDLERRALEQLAPLLGAQRAHVRRVAQLLGFLLVVGAIEHVLDHDDAVRDARHLADPGSDVVEVVRGDARDDHVERAVGEGQILGAADDVGLHARRCVRRHDLGAFFAQAPRHVAAAGRDVEHLHAFVRVAELDDGVEVIARRMRDRGAVQLGALVPGVGHFASSTALRAASSIVGST